MKNVFKSIGLLAILLFSFYYTEKIAIIMQNQSPIMQSITDVENIYLEEPVNATIDNDYIVPGIMGRTINKTKSYINMKSFGIFNSYYLVFDYTKPDISLEDNLDKIINQGNPSKNSVAFLLENGNTKVENYLENNQIPASLLITESTYQKNSYFEQINADNSKYQTVESLLNKNNQNTNICYLKSINKEFCLKNKKYLVEETFSLTNSNIVDAKKNLNSGAIILIKNNTSLDNVLLLLKEIEFKGLTNVTLSTLITEKNN